MATDDLRSDSDPGGDLRERRTAGPGDPADPFAPRLTAGAVARRLGVAVTTLRTWDQRYGLGPRQRQAGRHRRYGHEDVARLELMRRLTLHGVPPAEAARAALAATSAELAVAASAGRAAPPGMPLDQAQSSTRALVRAAVALDGDAIDEVVRSCLRSHGAVSTWTEVLVPVLTSFGHRWESGNPVVDAEHLLSWHVSTEFRQVGLRPPTRSAMPGVLLLAAPEEQHTLPLEALAAALRELRIPTRVLGARVPAVAAADAARRTGPALVLVWSQLPQTAARVVFDRLLAVRASPGRARMRVLAGGPGWRNVRLPADVVQPATLPEAVEIVRTVLRDSQHADER